MLLLFAAAWADDVERLTGVHLGLGGGVDYTSVNQYYSSGELYVYRGVSTAAGLRLRLSERVAIEPRISGSHSQDVAISASETDPKTDETSTVDRIAFGLNGRVRLASVDRADFLALAGATHARAWWAYEPTEGERQTSFGASTSVRVGIGLEYWLTRRLSLGVDLTAEVLDWDVLSSEPEETEERAFTAGFYPGGDFSVFLYF